MLPRRLWPDHRKCGRSNDLPAPPKTPGLPVLRGSNTLTVARFPRFAGPNVRALPDPGDTRCAPRFTPHVLRAHDSTHSPLGGAAH